jgi:mono/diheme cytochrome c family protein
MIVFVAARCSAMRPILATTWLFYALSSAAAQERGDPTIWLEIATEACSGCHAVKRVEDRSPQPNAPTFGTIASAGHERHRPPGRASIPA